MVISKEIFQGFRGSSTFFSGGGGGGSPVPQISSTKKVQGKIT